MKNCVIYVRTNNKDDYSIKNQEELLKTYLNDKNFNIKEVFVDNGYSGTNFNRPSFKSMIDYIKNNDIDLIVVKSIDRISRSTIDTINFLKEMKDLNIKVLDINNRDICKRY
jgi:DNA invertase Pin-like site-specific DNA recombinase